MARELGRGDRVVGGRQPEEGAERTLPGRSCHVQGETVRTRRPATGDLAGVDRPGGDLVLRAAQARGERPGQLTQPWGVVADEEVRRGPAPALVRVGGPGGTDREVRESPRWHAV